MAGKRRKYELYIKVFFGISVASLFAVCYLSYTDRSPNTLLSSVQLDPSWADTSKIQYLDNITLPPIGYVVYTDNCRIVDVNPINVYRPRIAEDCTHVAERFIGKQFNETTKRYHLHTNNHLKWMYVGNEDEISCCLKEIVRSGTNEEADNKFKLLTCLPFYQDHLVPVSTAFVIVECRSVSENIIVYQDAHFFLQESLLTIERRQQNATAEPEQRQQFGVLLLGIDSLSQINLRRTMPLTFSQLKRNDWFELSGYNKMGDNTYPNLMAFLTGLNETRVLEKCQPEEVGGLENCTLMWDLYMQQNFLTAYAEDESWMSTFNYLKPGFLRQPTDFYLRPFMMAAEENLPSKMQSGSRFCIGVRHAAEYIYDFAIEFAIRFRAQRTFGLFWTNSFSHNDYRDPASMDGRMRDYIEELETTGILNTSVVVLLSDHGSRYGEIRNIPSGFVEERLPMFFIWLPEHLRRKHPEFVYALRVNRHRLTSPYDIYVTLQHLLALANGSGAQAQNNLAGAESCPTCQSILLPVAENRSCADAGIPEHWCTCTRYDAIDIESEDMNRLVRRVVKKINDFLENKLLSGFCERLELSRLVEASYRIDEGSSASWIVFYRVRFEAIPTNESSQKDATFQSTFVLDKSINTINVDVSSISRLDSYWTHSQCIDDVIAKKFCICST